MAVDMIATAGRSQSEPWMRLTFSHLGLVLVADQLLLPLTQLGPIPFKISYFICAFWLLHWLFLSPKRGPATRDFLGFAGPFAVFLTCIVLGELWLSASLTALTFFEAIRFAVVLGLVVMAFGLGVTTLQFRIGWLIPIFAAGVVLNLLFSLFGSHLPQFLISFYYPDRILETWSHHSSGITSVAELLDLTRSRGLFGNPNASMLLMNLPVLFIHLGLRHDYLKIRSAIVACFLIAVPMGMSLLLGSRGEFIVAVILGFLNYRVLSKANGRQWRLRIFGLAAIAAVPAGVVMARYASTYEFSYLWARISGLASVLTSSDVESSIARPLLTAAAFMERFVHSPLFGTGISAADAPGFTDGTQYFHNDWFFVLAISGVIGFCSMVWLVRRFVWPLGWPALIPFFLPGLINTFLLNIPATITYFFLLGVFWAKANQNAAVSSQAQSV